LDELAFVVGLHKKIMKDVLGFYFHEARRRPIAATIVFFGDHASVENDLNFLLSSSKTLKTVAAPIGAPSMLSNKATGAKETRGQPSCSEKAFPAKRLSPAVTKEVEVFLAFIAKEEGFDHFHPELCVDGGAIFHRHGDVGVRSFKGNLPFREFLVNQCLEFARRLDRSLIGDRTDIKHGVILISPAVYHSILNNKNECWS
jgi:hypothetical protein